MLMKEKGLVLAELVSGVREVLAVLAELVNGVRGVPVLVEREREQSVLLMELVGGVRPRCYSMCGKASQTPAAKSSVQAPLEGAHELVEREHEQNVPVV